ncbi:hypothetical protein ANCDUO_02443 [Ancylostoma duodenale]|uniref:Uncharacterized protein n=1 Tax=Ancylostoma duodenale TaxID=51022 RepID=A0A0C2DWB4_9BILA|nr:hypothetical protein ANCDUO_02443 [Ancylostoma duodenale]
MVQLRKEDFKDSLTQLGMQVVPLPQTSTKILSILSPLVEYTPEELEVKNNLLKVIQPFTQRNELLALAYSDPDVWEFYDKHSPFVPQQSVERNLMPMCSKCGSAIAMCVPFEQPMSLPKYGKLWNMGP